MGLMDELRRLARPYEDEDDYEELDEEELEEDEEEEEPARRSSFSSFRRAPREEEPVRETRTAREPRERTYTPRSSYTPGARAGDKVVNINATTQLQVILVKPEKFENASDIADHLREKHTVVLNLESTQKEVARRLVDFLSGVAYAQEGKIKKISAATYIITPYNVDIIGDLVEELENNGLYF